MTDDKIWRVVQDVAAAVGWQDRDRVLNLTLAKLPVDVSADRLSRLWSERAEIKGAV